MLGARFRATVDVTEWLASQQFACVPLSTSAAVTPQVRALAQELTGDVLRSQLVVSIDPASHIRAGAPAEL
jgi:multiple sugar transport system ATP-binding protein